MIGRSTVCVIYLRREDIHDTFPILRYNVLKTIIKQFHLKIEIAKLKVAQKNLRIRSPINVSQNHRSIYRKTVIPEICWSGHMINKIFKRHWFWVNLDCRKTQYSLEITIVPCQIIWFLKNTAHWLTRREKSEIKICGTSLCLNLYGCILRFLLMWKQTVLEVTRVLC